MRPGLAVRVVFLGTPEYALPCLDSLVRAGEEVVAVYCPPDRPAGRGRRPAAPATKRRALELSIPVHQPASLRSEEERATMEALRPDAMVVAAFGKIIPEPLWRVPPLGCLNVHPSLLPRHRGPSPVVGAILEGDEVSGVSIMLIAEGVDSGPLLAQRREPLRPDETGGSLAERLFRLGAEMLPSTLGSYAAGELRAWPQDEREATRTRLVRKEHGLLRWGEAAQQLERRVRAYQPWPGAFSYWQGRMLKVGQAAAVEEGGGGGTPGQVVRWSAQGARGELPAVVTGRGLLVLRRIQIEGGRALAGSDFLRGHPALAGSHLPS